MHKNLVHIVFSISDEIWFNQCKKALILVTSTSLGQTCAYPQIVYDVRYTLKINVRSTDNLNVEAKLNMTSQSESPCLILQRYIQ